MPRVRVRALAVVVMLCGALASCGGDGAPSSAATTGDAELAQALKDNAEYYERERDAAVPEPDPLSPESPAEPQVPGSASLPAGSDEIDGPTSDGPSTPASSGPLLSAADARSFERLARTLPGSEGVAVAALGRGTRIERLGQLRTGVAWSTAKVPVAMAAIARGVADQADLRSAITASDNAAADRIWNALGAGRAAADATTGQLRAAGDSTTVVPAERLRTGYTVFGQTAWSLASQVRFVAGMPCTATGPRLLDLMGSVVSSQRWGLGATGGDAQLKGGWGPGISPGRADGWLDRQMGVVVVSGRPLAVAIATTAPDHAAGTTALSRIARWLVQHVSVAGVPREPAC